MVKSQAFRFEPRSKRSMPAQARVIVSCTRSSVRSQLAVREYPYARKLGMAARSSSRKLGSTRIALLPILPFQASHEHEEVTRHGLLQELLVHGPELLPDVVLGFSIQTRSVRPC